MPKSIQTHKEYKINGKMLYFISELASMYNEQQVFIYDNNDIKFIPFQSEKRDFLIGRLVHEFESLEWEEI